MRSRIMTDFYCTNTECSVILSDKAGHEGPAFINSVKEGRDVTVQPIAGAI